MKGMTFTPANIKLSLDGEKTHTRRTGRSVGLKKINENPDKWTVTPTMHPLVWAFVDVREQERIDVKPYYMPGETFYIKEAWVLDGGRGSEHIIYKLNDPSYCERTTGDIFKLKWGNPMFMPEWSARGFAKVTSVNIGRLHDMTEEDVKAEGLKQDNSGLWVPFEPIEYMAKDLCWTRHDLAFKQLWDSINKKYPWSMNPWVIDYGYKLLEVKKWNLKRMG